MVNERILEKHVLPLSKKVGLMLRKAARKRSKRGRQGGSGWERKRELLSWTALTVRIVGYYSSNSDRSEN